MTVAELIAWLQQQDQALEVYVTTGGPGCPVDDCRVCDFREVPGDDPGGSVFVLIEGPE